MIHYILIAAIATVFLLAYVLSTYTNLQANNQPNYTFPHLPQFPKQENKTTTIQLDKSCAGNLDCSWQTTNCCSANAGGSWNCINRQKSVIKCQQLVLCPQVISPEPTTACKCVYGSCEAQ